MRALRPRWTTGSWPVHRSAANLSGLTPNHRRASGRGISCGGAGSARGSSCCRPDRRRRGRTRRDGAAMAGVSPRRGGGRDRAHSRCSSSYHSAAVMSTGQSCHGPASAQHRGIRPDARMARLLTHPEGERPVGSSLAASWNRVCTRIGRPDWRQSTPSAIARQARTGARGQGQSPSTFDALPSFEAVAQPASDARRCRPRLRP